MVQIKWTFQAKDYLKSIADYIRLDSIKYAQLQISRIRSRTQILKTQPNAGRLVPEFENPKIRELIEGSYRVVYKVVSKEQIDILTIHHTARDMTKRTLE
jgi:toxin ParE1/3/4